MLLSSNFGSKQISTSFKTYCSINNSILGKILIPQTQYVKPAYDLFFSAKNEKGQHIPQIHAAKKDGLNTFNASTLKFGMYSSNHSRQSSSSHRSRRPEDKVAELERLAKLKLEEASVKKEVKAPTLLAKSSSLSRAAAKEKREAEISAQLANAAFRASENPFLPPEDQAEEYEFALRRKKSSAKHLKREFQKAEKALEVEERALDILEEASEEESEAEKLKRKADALAAKAAKKPPTPPPPKQSKYSYPSKRHSSKKPVVPPVLEANFSTYSTRHSEKASPRSGHHFFTSTPTASPPPLFSSPPPVHSPRQPQFRRSSQDSYKSAPAASPFRDDNFTPRPPVHTHTWPRTQQTHSSPNFIPEYRYEAPASQKAGLQGPKVMLGRVWEWREHVEDGSPE